MNNRNNYRKCAKCGKTRAEDMRISYYRFPNPGIVNILKAKAWAIYCWPEKDWSDVDELRILHKQNKVLCQRHFDDSCFYDSSKKTISKFAVPGTTQYVAKLMDTLRMKAAAEKQSTPDDEDLISIAEDVAAQEEEDVLYIPHVPKTEDEPNIPLPSLQVLYIKGGLNPEDTQKILDKEVVEVTLATEKERRGLDDVIMRDVRACRACLHTEGVLVKITNTYRRIFESACGLVVSPNDGYPYYFCVECMAQIRKILAFRRKSRRADFVLKEIMAVRKEVSSADVAAVDRKVTNLVSSLETWKPQNIYFYTYDKTTEGGNQFLNDAVKYDNGTIKIECSRDIVHEIEENKDADDLVDETEAGECGFDSVDDIVKKLGIDAADDVATMKEEVDLNDVFKGIEEQNSEDEMKKLEQAKLKGETRRERLYRKREEKKRLREERERNTLNNMSWRATAYRLMKYEIELLSVEEQIMIHEIRWRSEPFKSSLFKCTICVRVFANVQLLIEHCEEHNQTQGNFSCNVCKLRFESEEDASVHVAETHRYKYSCKGCARSIYNFKTAVGHKCIGGLSLKDASIDNELYELFHMVPQTDDEMRASLAKSTGSMRCVVCELAFTQNTAYKAHLDKHIKRPKSNAQCDICGIYHQGVNALARHMAHWHQYLWQCKTCDFQTSQRYRAIEHLEDHRASSAGCPYCPKTSKTHAGLKAHIRKAHYKEVYNRICPLCGLAFSSDILFYAHQLEKHKYIYLPHPPQDASPSKELACVHCNIEFASSRALETHALLYGHEEAKDIPYACLPCKKIFDSEESKNMHALRCKSNNAFPMPCCICGVEVTSGMNYYHHCRKTHPSCLVRHEGKLCEKCGKVLSRKKWIVHLCRKRNKLFQCTICEKDFLTSRSYGVHMIYKHTNRPFQCALCPDRFKRRIVAKEHILKVHTPVMPYTCSVCYRQFAVLKYLNEHASTFHGIDIKEDSTYKIKKEKSNIFIYPHMKLDVSSIDRNRLKEIKLEVRDYNNTVIETINNDDDYDKYLILDAKADKLQKKTRKRRKKNEIPVKGKKRKVESVVIESGENLEIIEVDGKKYVTIDDVVYQVENQ